MILPVCMNHNKHCTDAWFQRQRPYRVPSSLTRLVVSIEYDQAKWVLEDKSCQFERHAVLALVLVVLSFIPLVAQTVYTILSQTLNDTRHVHRPADTSEPLLHFFTPSLHHFFTLHRPLHT